jgi:hypothetical protein
MRRSKAHYCRALLVVLLLGFTALTLHTRIHAQPDQQTCEICSGHFNPSHAIAPAPPIAILGSGPDFATRFVPQYHESEPFTFYRPRAPPVLS